MGRSLGEYESGRDRERKKIREGKSESEGERERGNKGERLVRRPEGGE